MIQKSIVICILTFFSSANFLSSPQDDIITIPLKRVPSAYTSKIKALMQTSSQYHPTSFLQMNASAQVTLQNYANTQFVGQVGIGNPPQYLDIIFDTGSSNFWVNSKQCKRETCKSHPQYDNSKSRDFEELGYYIEVEFGTGTVEGEINMDTVTIAGIEIRNQALGEIVDEYGDVFSDGEFSGIMGLAYPEGSAYNLSPPFDSIIQQQLLARNIFAFYYSLNEDENAEITFGAVNPKRYTGDFTWTNVLRGEQFYWMIQIDDILYNGKSLGLCADGCRAAVDTGTSLITGPSRDLETLVGSMNFDCIDYDGAPDVTFVIEGKEFRLKAVDYIVTISENGEDIPGYHSDTDDILDCTVAFMPLDVSPPFGPLWVLGDIFFSHYYTVFDRDNDRIGFATAVHGDQQNIYNEFITNPQLFSQTKLSIQLQQSLLLTQASPSCARTGPREKLPSPWQP